MALTNIPTSTDLRIISGKGEKGKEAETSPKSGDLARLQAAGSLASMAELGSFEVVKGKSKETSKANLQNVQTSTVEMTEKEELSSIGSQITDVVYKGIKEAFAEMGISFSDEDTAEIDAAIYAASNPASDASTTEILGNWMFALQTVMMKATGTYQTNQELALQSADINNAQAKVFLDKLGDIVAKIKDIANTKSKMGPMAQLLIAVAVAVVVTTLVVATGGAAAVAGAALAPALLTAGMVAGATFMATAGVTIGIMQAAKGEKLEGMGNEGAWASGNGMQSRGTADIDMDTEQTNSQLVQTQLTVTQNEQQKDITTSQNQSSNIDAVQNLLQGLFRFALQISKSQA